MLEDSQTYAYLYRPKPCQPATLIYATKKNRSERWTVSQLDTKRGGGIQGISTASAARAETLSDALGARLYNCGHSRTTIKRVPTLGQERDCSRNTSTSPVPYPSRWIKQDHIKKQVFYRTHRPQSSEKVRSSSHHS